MPGIKEAADFFKNISFTITVSTQSFVRAFVSVVYNIGFRNSAEREQIYLHRVNILISMFDNLLLITFFLTNLIKSNFYVIQFLWYQNIRSIFFLNDFVET